MVDHLDAFTAPRLVEYFDENPCLERRYETSKSAGRTDAGSRHERRQGPGSARALGVSVEAQYTVGEYDIVILSAKESAGLSTWLHENGYRIPSGANAVLGSYIRQNMRFFVARVNLGEQSRLGFSYLRPLQVAYDSPKFMLPIRLGMVNADGAQDLFVFALTRTRARRDDELPHGAAADGHGSADAREGRLRAFLSRDVQRAGAARGDAGGVSRICLGHGLVRSLRGRSALERRNCSPSASSGRTGRTAHRRRDS